MNLGEIKSFLGATPDTNPLESAKQQLRDEGLRQASEGVGGAKSVTSQFSSQTSIGVKIFGNALNASVSLDNQSPKIPAAKSDNAALFDFEEIATNVLRFVGGVIQGAANGGADRAALESLFEQARSGVAKGIKLAEKDLAGFLNEEIETGISKSADLIESGLSDLERSLLGEPNNDGFKASLSAQSIFASSQSAGELTVETRDGDKVTISFERSREISSSQTQFRAISDNTRQSNDVLPRDILPTDDVESSDTGRQSTDSSPRSNVEQVDISQRSLQIGEQSRVRFQVSGDLDEQELAAINDLVTNAQTLASDFFNGDVEQAFEQALSLGFDEGELTSFALQLSQRQEVEVVRTYTTVSSYDEQTQSNSEVSGPVEKVGDYLAKFLAVLEQSQQRLADGEQYKSLLNGLINEVQEVDTSDLVTAINDFHNFNNRLVKNIPSNSQPQDA